MYWRRLLVGCVGVEGGDDAEGRDSKSCFKERWARTKWTKW